MHRSICNTTSDYRVIQTIFIFNMSYFFCTSKLFVKSLNVNSYLPRPFRLYHLVIIIISYQEMPNIVWDESFYWMKGIKLSVTFIGVLEKKIYYSKNVQPGKTVSWWNKRKVSSSRMSVTLDNVSKIDCWDQYD